MFCIDLLGAVLFCFLFVMVCFALFSFVSFCLECFVLSGVVLFCVVVGVVFGSGLLGFVLLCSAMVCFYSV